MTFTDEELKAEVWRAVPGFAYYRVSNLGRIHSDDRMVQRFRFGRFETVPKKGRFLRYNPDSCGYPQVKLYHHDKTFRTIKVHLVVALAFLANPDNLPFLNHLDGDKTNHRLSNLERCTAQENTRHAWRKGLCTPNIGEKSGMSKLKEIDIPIIRELIASGMIYAEIGLRYGVTGTNIYYIAKGTTWRHVP